MADKPSFCIHGAGGLGSVIGGYLARVGYPVTLIARKPHVDAINADGLGIDGVRGSFTVRDHLRAVTHPDRVEGPIDYYILLTKAKDAEAALADAEILAPRVGAALSLQNGIGKEQAVAACFGTDKVIGGSILEGATLVGPGQAHNHVTVPVTAYFGEFDAPVSPRSQTLAQAFNDAGLGARAVDDIRHVLWEKIVQVGGASAWSASTLVGMPALDYWDGLASPAGSAHYICLAKELINVYKAMGYKPQNFFAPVSRLREIDSGDLQNLTELFAGVGVEKQQNRDRQPVRTSLHCDLLAGRKTEVDEILKPLLDAAARYDIPTPTFTGAYRVIKTLHQYGH